MADNPDVFLRAGHVVQLVVIALLSLAVIMVHSAGMSIRQPGSDLAALLTSRSVIYAVLAVAAMFLASRIDVREMFRTHGWTNPLFWVIGLTLGLLVLTLIPGMGRSINGASRWLYIGPRSWNLSFQPSELAKWIMVFSLAWWCARRAGVMHRFTHGLMPPLMLVGLVCALIVVEDLGTAALVGLVSACLLIAGGARLWQLGLLLPLPVAALVGMIVFFPYRMARLLAFSDPFADPEGIGYHPIQSMLAIAQGGLFGRGLGNGVQKFGYLPEDTTDFIFAVICEELGIAGAGLVVVLYLVLIWVGLTIIRDCRDAFSRLVGLGVLLTIGLQALMNIAVVTVVVPPKGIALPLLSSGGTGWILTAFALGLLAALDEANRLDAEAAADAPARLYPQEA